MLLELEIRESNHQPRTVTTRQPKTVIGRSSRADIKLTSDLVSSRHAALKVYSNGCVVEDLGSSNGTFVNTQRIAAPTECPNGTKIQLGDGGPTITILSGSSEPPVNEKSDSGVSSSASSGTAMWLAGGVAVMLLAMFVLCGLGGIGIALRRNTSVAKDAGAEEVDLDKGLPDASSDSNPDSDTVSAADLNGAVTLVYCGWKIVTTTGQSSEESAIVNIVGVNPTYDQDQKPVISDEYADYVTKYVKKGGIGIYRQGGKATFYEQLLGSSGTGFPVTKDGFILTNKHVVEEVVELSRATAKMAAVRKMRDYSEAAPTIWVFVGGEPFPADVVHVSQTYDMAIIKCSERTAKYFSLSTAGRIQRGTNVSAIGFPGVVRDLNESITGLLGRDVNKLGASGTAKGFLSDSDLDYYQTFGQINSQSKVGSVDVLLHGAKINHGNSGGPLLNSASGVVLGINTWGDSEGDVNASQTLGQMRSEIDRHVPGVRWVD